MKKQILPVGFYDLIFDEAQQNHRNINIAIDSFLKQKYRLIKTPLVEFAQNFACDENEKSFQVLDVISGKNLVFRNDITPQISRLINTQLKNEKLPIRLCYFGDVLCMKSENLYQDRQQTQVGLELIGTKDEKYDFEIIKNLLTVLEKFKLENLLIEFSLPDFFTVFCDEFGIKETAKENLQNAVKQKNISAIKKIKNADLITKIMLSNQPLDKIIAEISHKTKAKKILQQLQKAQKISQFLQKNFPKIIARFDLFGDQNSSYHHGFVFNVFVSNFPYAIAKGGKYKIQQNGFDLDAVGATIYMNNLRKIK